MCGQQQQRSDDYITATIEYVYPRRRRSNDVESDAAARRRKTRARLQQDSFPDRILLYCRHWFQDPALVDDHGKIPGWHYPKVNETENSRINNWRPSHASLHLVLDELMGLPSVYRKSVMADLKKCLQAKHLLRAHSYNRDRHSVAIGNARTLLPNSGSLSTNGFTLLHHPSSKLCEPHPDGQWEDDSQIINVYYRELESLILSSGIIPGAAHAFANSFIRRQSSPISDILQNEFNKEDDETSSSSFYQALESLFRESSTGRSPSTAAHNDFTIGYGAALKRSIETGIPHTQTFGFEEAVRERILGSEATSTEVAAMMRMLGNSRLIVLNTWRSVTPGPRPLERDPIVLCDRRTMHPSSLHVTTGTRRADTGKKIPFAGPPPDPTIPPLEDVPSLQSDCFRAGRRGGGVNSIAGGRPGGGLDAYYAEYDQRHQWYYYPGMTREEVAVWVGYDSDPPSSEEGEWQKAGHPSLAGSTMHTSFVPPNVSSGAQGRRSIDVRVLVLVPKKTKSSTGDGANDDGNVLELVRSKL